MTTAMILLPLGVALAIWLAPLDRLSVVGLALAGVVGEIALWIATMIRFDWNTNEIQFADGVTWFEDLGAAFSVGLFQYSLWLIGMTVIVMGAAIAYAVWAGRERPRAYFGLMLLLMSATVAVFTAQDMLLFYVAWEAMLIPLYFLVGIWGGANRAAATYKFVVYTIAGSLMMLAAIVVYGYQNETFSLNIGQTGTNSTWIFLGFAAAFAIKAPLFPFHGWLVQTYREAPPEVAAVLSGVISKTAVYGFLRIGLFNMTLPADELRTVLIAFGAAGLIYGSLMAFRQRDLRGIVAYSSLAQMGLITMGIFALDISGIHGAVLQMVNHGLVSGVLFLLAGIVERRTGSGDIAVLGGMARGRPILATVVILTGMVALAVPGSTTFAGELLILIGVFSSGWGWTVAGAAAIVLAAMYALRLISVILHERKGAAVSDSVRDLRLPELAFIAPLVACLIALSVWPAAVASNPVFPKGADACKPMADVLRIQESDCPGEPGEAP